ncbi:AHH domain-containing protein [Haliangium ochraceum]|uniref:AHH domain-containing protein n=1 Tax=Haliangium ochraceum TaxID=80816 RepID=UPI00019BA7EA|nr:AHH domain-containing protein [Haliangium ochraceum]
MTRAQQGDQNQGTGEEHPHQIWQRLTMAAEHWALPNAADHLLHYLSGTAAPLAVDVDELLRDSPELNAVFEAELELLGHQISKRGADGSDQDDVFTASLDQAACNAAISADWRHALGSFSGQITAEPITQPDADAQSSRLARGHLSIRGHYHGPNTPLLIGDETFTAQEFAKLRAAGYIKAFPLHGTSSDRTTTLHAPAELDTLAQIRAILDEFWVDDFDEFKLLRLWASFGDSVFEVAAAHPDLWKESNERGAPLGKLPAVIAAQARFRADVQTRAREILRDNEAAVLAEMEALGTNEAGRVAPAESFISEDMQAEQLAAMQDRASLVVSAQKAQRQLESIPVGYRLLPPGRMHGPHPVVAHFDPAQPPQLPPVNDWVPEEERAQVEFRLWADVKHHHNALHSVIAQLTGNAPALHQAVSQGNDDALATMAAGSPDEARQVMAEQLGELLANIRSTVPKIGGDLDDRDLTPIHQQFFAGASSSSGTDWSAFGPQWAAQHLLDKHESQAFWLSLGLGTAAAALFVVATIASGGMALALAGGALAVGGAQVGMSWEHAEDLDTAAGAGTGTGTLVTQADADAARNQAIIESAFLFLDLIPAVRGAHALSAAGKASAKQAGLKGAKNWSELESKYIGKKLTEVGTPTGYTAYPLDGRMVVRRIRIDDELFAAIHLDADGVFREGLARAQRVSNPAHVARSVDTLLEAAGVAKPAHHQAHHILPIQLFREHELLREALRRGIVSPDAVDNLVLLARTEVRQPGKASIIPEKVAGVSEGLPRHQGPHRLYTDMVRTEANDVMDELLQGRTLREFKDDKALAGAVAELQQRARNIMATWHQRTGLDALK